jgi:transposase
MPDVMLNKLLLTREARLYAFAVCEVREAWRPIFDPEGVVTLRYVLAGSGVLRTGGAEVPYSPRHILIVPAQSRQSLGAPGGDVREAAAKENCSLLADGLVRLAAGGGFSSAGGGGRDTFVVCATISATYGGGLGLFDQPREPVALDVSGMAALGRAFEAMLAEMAAPGVGTQALAEALMKQCLILVLRDRLLRDGLFAALGDARLVYNNRNVVERLWARLKEWRAVSTRYEEPAASFMGVLCLAAATDWLKP